MHTTSHCVSTSTDRQYKRINAPKASGAQAALHSAGTDRPGQGTSHVLHNGGLSTFMEANEPLMTVGIWKY